MFSVRRSAIEIAPVAWRWRFREIASYIRWRQRFFYTAISCATQDPSNSEAESLKDKISSFKAVNRWHLRGYRPLSKQEWGQRHKSKRWQSLVVASKSFSYGRSPFVLLIAFAVSVEKLGSQNWEIQHFGRASRLSFLVISIRTSVYPFSTTLDAINITFFKLTVFKPLWAELLRGSSATNKVKIDIRLSH